GRVVSGAAGSAGGAKGLPCAADNGPGGGKPGRRMESEMPEKNTGAGFRPTEPSSVRKPEAKHGSGPVGRKPTPPTARDTVELTHSARLMSRLEEAVAEIGRASCRERGEVAGDDELSQKN